VSETGGCKGKGSGRAAREEKRARAGSREGM
jgi:hypothetical protein